MMNVCGSHCPERKPYWLRVGATLSGSSYEFVRAYEFVLPVCTHSSTQKLHIYVYVHSVCLFKKCMQFEFM